MPPGGYAWWYADGLSSDGQYGFTVIAFIGSVFSPYYAWSGRNRPDNHVAFNVALYGPGTARWAMTERGSSALSCDARHLAIGPSALAWDGNALTITIDERCAPLPRRVKGTIRLTPHGLFPHGIALDGNHRHVWQPIASRAAVEVNLDAPNLAWRGEAYFDANSGNEPIEHAFSEWQWSRAHLTNDTAIVYEGARRDGSRFEVALRFDAKGEVRAVDLPPVRHLPITGWRMPRYTRADRDAPVMLRRTWEDAPFYARTSLSTRMFGEDAEVVHESILLNRLVNPAVRLMLPFRMPRISR